MATAVNFRTSLRLHNDIATRNFPREQKQMRNDQSWPHRFPCRQLRAHFKYGQIQSHVQMSRESHDLNIGVCSQTAIRIGFYARISHLRYVLL